MPKSFKELLAEFVKAQDSFNSAGIEVSHAVIDQFKADGNLSFAQQFHDAMTSEGMKNHFMAWLVAHSPAKKVNGKIVKDKLKEEQEGVTCWRIGEAKANPWYSFANKSFEIKDFGADDINTALLRVLKRFENHERYQAKDAEAKVRLDEAKKVVQLFANTPTMDLLAEGEELGDIASDTSEENETAADADDDADGKDVPESKTISLPAATVAA